MDILRKFSKNLSKNKTAALILCILLLGIGLRLYRLNYQSLWTDEMFTYRGASDTISKIIFEPEVNLSIQPLYYSIVHFFVWPTENQEALLRLPSVIFGSLSILLLYFIVRNWLGRGGAILSAMIMAISPFHIWYSQEARPYAMLIFLGLLSIWFLQKLLKDEVNFWWRFGFIISTASILYCHTVGIAFISFLVVYILLVVPRLKWKVWLPVFISILILILPALYRMAIVPPIVRGSQAWRTFHPLSLPYLIWTFSTGYSLGPTLAELHMPDRVQILFKFFPLILPIMMFFLTIIGFGAFQLKKLDSSIFWCATLWFVFPLAFAVFGAIFTPNEFNVRYTVLSFPPFILFLVTGFQIERFKWVRLVFLAVVGLLSAYSLSNHFFDDRYHKENNRAAGQFLSTHAMPNDLIICSAAYTDQDLKHYYSRNDLKIVRYPAYTLYVKPNLIEPDIKKIIEGRDHFWLFLSRTFHSDPNGYLRQYCDQHFPRELDFKSIGVELILYRKS